MVLRPYEMVEVVDWIVDMTAPMVASRVRE